MFNEALVLPVGGGMVKVGYSMEIIDFLPQNGPAAWLNLGHNTA